MNEQCMKKVPILNEFQKSIFNIMFSVRNDEALHRKNFVARNEEP